MPVQFIAEEDELSDSSSTRDSSEEEYGQDQISNMPDEILFHILSRFRFKYALATNRLSSQWRDFWNRPIVKHGNLEDIDCAVGNLIFHFDVKNPLRYPRNLQFHFDKCLVLLATIGLRRKLHLDFSKGKNHEFSRQFGWKLDVNNTPINKAPPNTFFVQTLNLTSVNYLTSEVVSSLISNFQFLKSLTIVKCQGLRSLRIDVVSRLLNLTVMDCPHLTCLDIEAYELESLRFRGNLCWFTLRGELDLQDAMLDFRKGPGYRHFKYNDFDPLLGAISDVEVLTLTGWMSKEILCPWLFSGNEDLRFDELRDLWWIDSSMNEDKIHALFCFLQFCPSLKRLFISIDPASYSTASNICDSWKQVSEQRKMHKLKVVKVEGFTDDDDIIFLKKHFLKVFNAEPRIVAATHGSPSRCLIRVLMTNDNKKPRKGRSKKRKYTYKFVEEVEDNIGICSKHAHLLL